LENFGALHADSASDKVHLGRTHGYLLADSI
jgi:hypothetical protein